MVMWEMEVFVLVRKNNYLEYVNYLFCLDVDECLSDSPPCSANATCENTIGGFNCYCNSGYTGNGSYCIGKQHWYVNR